MKAITIRVLGPTNHRPARLVATDSDGHKTIRSMEYLRQEYHDRYDLYDAAAIDFCKKMDWTGRLHWGYLVRRDEAVYVFENQEPIVIGGS